MVRIISPEFQANQPVQIAMNYLSYMMAPAEHKQVVTMPDAVATSLYGFAALTSLELKHRSQGDIRTMEVPDLTGLSADQALQVVTIFQYGYFKDITGRPSRSWEDPRYNGYSIGALADFDPDGNIRSLMVDDSLFMGINTVAVAFDGTLYRENPRSAIAAYNLTRALKALAPTHYNFKDRDLPIVHRGRGLTGFINRTTQALDFSRAMRELAEIDFVYAVRDRIYTTCKPHIAGLLPAMALPDIATLTSHDAAVVRQAA